VLVLWHAFLFLGLRFFPPFFFFFCLVASSTAFSCKNVFGTTPQLVYRLVRRALRVLPVAIIATTSIITIKKKKRILTRKSSTDHQASKGRKGEETQKRGKNLGQPEEQEAMPQHRRVLWPYYP
jgi:hypothetical protein